MQHIISQYPPNAPSPNFSQDAQRFSQPFQMTPPFQLVRANDSMWRTRLVIPEALNNDRLIPGIEFTRGPGNYFCCYCESLIMQFEHVFLDCGHHMHPMCTLRTMRDNGVDLESGDLFCPACHESSSNTCKYVPLLYRLSPNLYFIHSHKLNQFFSSTPKFTKTFNYFE